ncbi:MAG: hypothetical protein NT098_01210 [Candidatus Parcubacteria bacterium]|nr:hypothetical protein [Candidatus Parcubacteria bacterium]
MKKLYHPSEKARELAHKTITELCERMSKMPSYELFTMKPEMERLAVRFPDSAEFLGLEPEEMVRRHKMGIEAAQVLILR